jgi:hypothetical protein
MAIPWNVIITRLGHGRLKKRGDELVVNTNGSRSLRGRRADGLDWSSISVAQFDFEIDAVKFVNRKKGLNGNAILSPASPDQ